MIPKTLDTTDLHQSWWPMLVIPAFRNLKQEGCEFKAGLGYIVSSQVSMDCIAKPCSEPIRKHKGY